MKRVLQSLALMVMVGLYVDSYASIITITSTADAGIGTLRNSVDSASAGDTITVDPILSGALISLVSGEIAIDKNLTIVGLGGSNIAVTANNLSRIFNISSGVNAIIAGWTLAQGNVTGDGGGILNAGTLNLDDVKLLGCVSSGNGGGIYSTGSVTTNETVIKSCIATGNGGGVYGVGTISIFFSTVEDNEAVDGAGVYGEALVEVANSLIGDNVATGNGAGIYIDLTGTALYSKTMVTGNAASGNGGGFYTVNGDIAISRSTFNGNSAADGGAVYTLADFSAENSTFSGNSASGQGGAVKVGEKFLSRGNTYTLNDAGTDGGAIYLNAGSFLRINAGSIVYGNTVGGATADDIANASTLFSSTYNMYGVIDDGSFTAGSGDQIGVDPMLIALADNGGETLTHAVACGSAAVNAGNPASSLVLDQRSEVRPAGGGHDIGSFELQDTCVAGPTCFVDSVQLDSLGSCDPLTDTYTSDVTVYYSDAPATGSLDVNGQTYAIGTSPQTVTLTGLLSDGLAVDATASFTDDAGCTLTATALWTAPAACAPVCAVDSVQLDSLGSCDPLTDTYTSDVTVYYTNAPATGSLEVNGQSYAIATSPQTVTLTGLLSDGLAVDATASFTDDAGCTLTELAAWTAPVSCFVPTCSVDSVQLDSLGSCDPLTDTYTVDVTVYYSNEPATGSLDVNGQTYAITTSPQTVTLTGLLSDGLAVDATASFTDDAGCTLTELAAWTAPASCFVAPCSIDAITVVTQTPCNGSTNEYEQVISVSYSNAPATGSLDVNGQLFSITTSPQTVTLTGLVSDSLDVDAVASFTDDGGCTLTEVALWTAPPSCVGPVDCVTLTPTGLTSNQLGSGAMELSWDPVPQTLACRLNGKPVTAPVYALVSINSSDGTPPTKAVIGAVVLTDGLSYDWRIKCACAVPVPMPSEITQFSAVDTFTYIAPRLENPDQIDLVELTVYPNPTAAGIYVTSPILPLGDVFVEVLDMAGRVYHTSKFESAGMTHQVEISSVADLPAGNYIVSMRHAEGVYKSNFTKVD